MITLDEYPEEEYLWEMEIKPGTDIDIVCATPGATIEVSTDDGVTWEIYE